MAERGTRKLAAIMFTDIKSFSKKMSENESMAMELLRIHDDTLKTVIEKYDGKIIKAIGDAFMVDFSSAVNAVKCAIEAQEAFWQYNQGKEELEMIEVRIGIHLGDVISDGNDIFGDGVNIAARIEAVTEPNRICISHDVYSQIKNKMQIKTYHMGSIELKNIPEPVEVYEVLIDTIPDFAEPSKSATQMPSKRVADKTTKREAKEAEKVEAAKKKSEEERSKLEKETQEKVSKLYARAEKLFNDGKFAEAEAELNEIFKLVAFHAGAQMLQARMEEDRTKHDDEARKKTAARKIIEQRIGKLMEEALTMVEQDNFTEALLKVREILSIDKNHSEAKQLESQIQEAEKAKEELDRSQVETETGTEAAPPEPPAIPPQGPAVAEPATAEEPREAAPAPPPRPVGLRRKRKRIPRGIIRFVGVAILAVAVYYAYPTLHRFIIPKDTSLAVFPFGVSSDLEDTSHVGEGLAALIADDLSRYGELIVVAPTSSFSAARAGLTGQRASRDLQVQHILTGEILSLEPRLSVRLRLSSMETNSVLWEGTIESDMFSFGPIRSSVISNTLKVFEVETQPKEFQRLSGDPEVNELYLRGVWYASQLDRDDVLTGIRLLRRLINFDTAFAAGQAALGKALLHLYEIDGERDKSLLREAVDVALAARSLNPGLPLSYEVLGSAYRAVNRFGQAVRNLEQALDLQAGNAECFRQLALIALVEGEPDKGLRNVSKALLLDSRNSETQEVAGHVYYFKQQYSSALNSYDKAISLGGSSYFITSKYKMAVWGAGLSPDPVAQFVEPLIRKDPKGYVPYYLVGRAYMLSGIWSEAKKYLEPGAELARNAIKANPNDVNARSFLALFSARLGESSAGLSEIDKALELSNDAPLIVYRKAQYFAIQSDKKQDAFEWLRKAVKKEYILSEVMNPDFAFLAKEPEFLQTISLRITSED